MHFVLLATTVIDPSELKLNCVAREQLYFLSAININNNRKLNMDLYTSFMLDSLTSDSPAPVR